MKSIFYSFIVALLILGNASNNPSQQQMKESARATSEEEQLVRGVYEKLVLYNRAAYSLPGSKEPAPESILRFELKNFHTGPIEEVKGALEKDIVTVPLGEVIRIAHGVETINGGSPSAFYVASWSNDEQTPEVRPEWTLGEALGLQAGEFFDVGKYTSYEVTVHLQGKSRTYRAIVIFHNLYESAQNSRPVFRDPIGADNSLNEVLAEKLPPRGSTPNRYRSRQL